MKRQFPALLTPLLFVTSLLNAQETTGNLEGRILDARAHPLPEVAITVSGPRLLGIRGTNTDAAGLFRVMSLPPGTYEVKVTHVAHQSVTYHEVVVALGRTTSLGELQLTPRTIEMAETIISHERPLIDPSRMEMGGNLEIESIQSLPIQRNFQAIISLLPQVNESYLGDGINIAGSTGLENMYFVDGVNVTDPFLAFGGMNLPYNFIQEIQVKSAGYEAQYGRAIGGIVDVITRSGGNEFHGEAFGFYTNNQFAGEPVRGVVDLETGDYSEYDAGFGVGGPVIRDNLWFFAAYDGAIHRQDISVPGLGAHDDRKTSNRFAGKLTWQAGNNTNVVFTALGDITKHQKVGPYALTASFAPPTSLTNVDPFLGLVDDASTSFSASVRHALSDRFFVNVVFSRFDKNQEEKGATERGVNEAILIDRTTGSWTGGYSASFSGKTSRTAASALGSLTLGDHTALAGIAFEDNFIDMDWKGTDPGWVEKFSDTSFRALYFRLAPTVHNRVVSAYLQDQWQVLDRLGVHVGVRWDGQYFVGETGTVDLIIASQIQPRVEVGYRLGEQGTQKISATYGRFFEQLPLNPATEAFGTLKNGFNFYHQNPQTNAVPPDSTLDLSSSPSSLQDIEGQYFDEFTLGYEAGFTGQFRIGARGIYRKLRQGINNGLHATKGFVLGNPGRGDLSFLPSVWREYTAMELSAEFSDAPLRLAVSYVISKSYGNFPGVYDSDLRGAISHSNNSQNLAEQFVNSTGMLPQDRTHVLKCNGSYDIGPHLTVGTYFIWESGTPLSVFGGTGYGPPFYRFLQQRGTVGRMPDVWDWSMRFTYRIPAIWGSPLNTKVILDMFHIGNQRDPVVIDQVQYRGVDQSGNQAFANPTYGKVIVYQPPRTLRLGVEVGF